MNKKHNWITPFMKQCYVTAGVSVNMLSHGMVVGYSAVLLPQLRKTDSEIQVDETSESWLASVFGITYFVGNIISSNIIDKFGRKRSYLISVIITAFSWYMNVWTSSITSLIVSRAINGVSLGMSGHISPIMIGEYTSPCYRGAFLATISMAISSGVFITHAVGSYLHWRATALICALILTFDFLIVCFSPETPSWLISKGRYDECKKVFRWLRGLNEEEELKKMIEQKGLQLNNNKGRHETLMRRCLQKLTYYKATAVKEEFYKPCLVVIHLHVLGQWGGSTILSQFTTDIFTHVIGDGIDIPTMTVILAAHRIISGVYVTIMLDKLKRRTVINIFGSLTIMSLLAIASYAYLRPRNLLPFEHPAIGISLIHLQVVSVSSGCVGFAFIITGELFPLEYKALAGALSMSCLSANLFILGKTGPYFLQELGIQTAYCIYAGVATYCMIVIILFLPETKNKTLQDIEDGLRKSKTLEEEMVVQRLTT